MRGATLCIGLLATALTGCKRGEDQLGGGSITWISEGDGPASAAPLYRFSPGSRAIVKQLNWRYPRIDAGTIELPSGRRALRSVIDKDAHWLAESEEGLFLVGSPRDGELDVPVLMVPSQVRLGMEWAVDVNDDGDDDYWFRVTDRQEDAPTLLGPRTTWTISLVGEQNLVLVDRTYAEGLGLIRLSYTTTLGLPAVSTVTDVVLTSGADAGAGLPDARPALSLEPLEGPDGQLSFGRDGHHLSVLQPGDDGRSIVQVVGDGFEYVDASQVRPTTRGTCVETTDAPLLGRVEGRVIEWTAESAPWLERLPPGCLRRVVSTGDRSLDDIASDASASLIDDGELVALRVTEKGALSDEGIGDDRYLLLFRDDEGRVRTVRHHSVDDDQRVRDWEERMLGPDTPIPELEPARRAFDGWGGWTRTRLGRWDWHLGDDPMRLLYPTDREGDRLPVLAFGYDGLLTRSEYAIQGRWEDPWPAGAVAGTSVSVRTAPRRREALVTSMDGVIDRLTIGSDGEIVQERVGTVVLPAGHRLAGAARVAGFGPVQAGERLIIATSDHAPISEYPEADSRLFEGSTWLWSTTIDRADGRAVDPPGVSAQAAGRDLVVCWPGGGSVEREGWTLGGAPAAAVIPIHDQCALVVRDLDDAMATPQLGAWAATGTVPGVGAVEIGLTADPAQPWQAWDLGFVGTDWNGDSTHHTPLSDGGFATVASEHAPGGVLWGQAGGSTPSLGSEIGYDAGQIVSSIGGHGFWQVLPPDSERPNLYLQGRAMGSFEADAITAITEAGGVWIVETDGTCTAVEPSGDTDTCPIDALDSALHPSVVLRDGTVCGVLDQVPACQRPGGVVKRASTDAMRHARFQAPLGDDTWLVAHSEGIGAIHVDSMRLAWTRDGSGPVRVNADGSVWAAHDGGLVAVTPTGLEPVALPGRIADYPVVDVLPAGEVLVLVFEGWPAGRFPATVGLGWTEDDVGYARIPLPQGR